MQNVLLTTLPHTQTHTHMCIFICQQGGTVGSALGSFASLGPARD